MMPSEKRRQGSAKTEPGDENNRDISSLVGKVDIRQLEHFSQGDADVYSYTGGLNRTTQGLLEFVEMFKAPLRCCTLCSRRPKTERTLEPKTLVPCPFKASSSPTATNRNGNPSKQIETTRRFSTGYAWRKFPTAFVSPKSEWSMTN